MAGGEGIEIKRLQAGDISLFRQMNDVFAVCFDDPESYLSAKPSDSYLAGLLAREHVIPVAAMQHGNVVGALVAYELEKFEQQRREIYIYDLAVLESHRRRGIATRLIGHVASLARERKAWVVYIQADRGDAPAIALYSKLGRGEKVLHFDIEPST